MCDKCDNEEVEMTLDQFFEVVDKFRVERGQSLDAPEYVAWKQNIRDNMKDEQWD